MYKAKLKRKQRKLLLELMRVIAEADGSVSYEEMDMIHHIRKMYHLKRYKLQHLTLDEIREQFQELDEEQRKDILTHVILLAMADGEFSQEEQVIIKSFFDLLSLDSIATVQKMINTYSKVEYDLKQMFSLHYSEGTVSEESKDMLDEFSTYDADDIDEYELMAMKIGPIRKVWDKVIELWNVVNDPKNDKAVKAMAIGALVYLITPLDVIPDFLPFVGLTDDLAVITYAFSKVLQNRQK